MSALAVLTPPSVLRRLTGWLDAPELDRWFEWPDLSIETIKVEEQLRDGELLIRAELPGIDPDNDVVVEVADGVLMIQAERKQETKDESEGRVRTEFHYGSFVRRLVLPPEVDVDTITATYTDGILEVRLPMPPPPERPATKSIEVNRS